ncbi:hypothetical protein ACWKWC_06955, partial [Geodermatophilus nigrescens]
MTVQDEPQDGARCVFPGCPAPPRPRVPGRSGPSPRFCDRPDHNPETARTARARAAGRRNGRLTATATALAQELPPEGRVRHLVGRGAEATREAAEAAEAQA